MNVRITFEEWMENYATSNYIPATIKSYIRSLSRLPEILGIVLKKPIMEYTSVDEFSEVYESILKMDGFAEKNRNYQHGSISAALGAYKKYLMFLEKIQFLKK